MRVVAIVTAAGRGARAGGPKALRHDAAGVSLAALHAASLLDAGVDEVLVVVRASVAAALGPALPCGARAIVSDEPDQDGPLGSLRAAARALEVAPRPDVVVVTPVDKRPAEAALVRALLTRVRDGAAAAKPTCDGRGGHPLAIRQDLFDASVRPATSGVAPSLRATLRARDDVARVPAGIEVLEDLDDEDALAAAGYGHDTR